ncbi:MAG TPA: aminotransferase class V-fold PLP-dependent enzyme [Candidatus Competibacteraceae bacterium]|nr:MAG: aminotransferase class V-fold PLP-dependent enzyme [Candidatus Competibacteraceae bacterium]HNW78140.1 aminotransferase class V-fold PLP-dependent enzyme [Candidatus Competibacteraceae bacterium]HQC72983.1 aminotransferase class V-fold PLP-dependent enzyme [Candidatus Competibacteraceae bacterium]
MPLSLDAALRSDFIGLDTCYPRADGGCSRRVYLDSAASTLALGCARQLADALLRHYANTHSSVHFSARIASAALDWARAQMLDFVHADPERHTALFIGNGCTAPLNRLARSLAARRPERDVVLVSRMEHHANDLPHRRHAGQVLHIPLRGTAPALGAIDLDALDDLLEQQRGRINYIAVAAASNVTGIVNPVHDIAARAHVHGAWIVVDASQALAHAPLPLSDTGTPERELDVVVFSGHKLYAPGSPGVAILRRSLLQGIAPDELGGGMVDDVSLNDYQVSATLPEREEAGTPNIIGAVQLGAVLKVLRTAGMNRIHAHEQTLLSELLSGLATIPGLRLYGDPDLQRTPRLGTVAFNLTGLEHGLVAAVLNDYHTIALRNGCFCAHPYVRELLKPDLWSLDLDPDAEDAMALLKPWQGMVRASLGLYTSAADIAALLAALRDLRARADEYRAHYRVDSAGQFHHRHFTIPARTLFDPDAVLAQALRRLSDRSGML